jgi:hypothetical protein
LSTAAHNIASASLGLLLPSQLHQAKGNPIQSNPGIASKVLRSPRYYRRGKRIQFLTTRAQPSSGYIICQPSVIAKVRIYQMQNLSNANTINKKQK